MPSAGFVHQHLRPARIVLLVAAVVVATILGGAALVLRHDHQRDIAFARDALTALDTALAEQTERALQSVEMVVEDVAGELQEGAQGDAEALRLRATRPALHGSLRARIAGIPQLGAVTVIAPDGTLLNFSRYWPIPAVNVADRDYFIALRDHPERLHFISEPVLNRGSGTWTIYLARRLSAPDGGFLGLVLGAMDLDYFQNLYARIPAGSGSSLSLWRSDGRLLALHPPSPRIGELFDRGDRFQLAPGEQRVLRSDDTVDGTERLIALTALPRFDLVVGVTRRMTNVLAPWRAEAATVAAGAVLCTLAAIALALLLIRRFAAYEAIAEALRARQAAEAGQQQAEAQLAEARRLESVGRLTAGVAHDFNNLLTTVLGNAELIRRRPHLDPATATHAGNICKAVDRGALLTRQLLAYARQQVLTPQPVLLQEVLAEFLPLLRTSVAGSVRLRPAPVPDGLWPAFADPAQVEQAVLNLVLNARDAMPNGGEIGVVLANCPIAPGEPAAFPPPGDYVRISVVDTGRGMPPDVLSRAFEPFFTTKSTGGSGLGLSQVLGFARQSGGDVRIDSTPGKGTRVDLLLPRAAEAPGTLLRDASHPAQEAGGGSQTPQCQQAEEVDPRLAGCDMPGCGLPGRSGTALAQAPWATRPSLQVV